MRLLELRWHARRDLPGGSSRRALSTSVPSKPTIRCARGRRLWSPTLQLPGAGPASKPLQSSTECRKTTRTLCSLKSTSTTRGCSASSITRASRPRVLRSGRLREFLREFGDQTQVAISILSDRTFRFLGADVHVPRRREGRRGSCPRSRHAGNSARAGRARVVSCPTGLREPPHPPPVRAVARPLLALAYYSARARGSALVRARVSSSGGTRSARPR